ncbi:MAG: group III truncated hemoglobin [Haliea sp.]|jgi:hemoglobin|nr:group III truncated hemoglobin [Haliea sp.]MDP5065569.1 group III truncated hemoglobin [Haliea sp.]
MGNENCNNGANRGKPDLDCRANIEAFVQRFYARVLTDPQLAPIFLDVAQIDLDVHLPHIVDYWCKLLLGEQHYRRHTMAIHRRLHHQQPLQPADFARWVATFTATVDTYYCGERAERAKRVAAAIAGNMQQNFPA